MLDKKTDLAGPGISTYEQVDQVLPDNYASLLDRKRTQQAIYDVKEYIEKGLADELNLMLVQVPLIVEAASGMNDMLDRDGSRTPVEFDCGLGLDQPIRAFGNKIEDRDEGARYRRLPDGPLDLEVDVEQLRLQNAVGNQRDGKQRTERIDQVRGRGRVRIDDRVAALPQQYRGPAISNSPADISNPESRGKGSRPCPGDPDRRAPGIQRCHQGKQKQRNHRQVKKATPDL